MIKNEEQRDKLNKATILLHVAQKTIKVMREIREMDKLSNKELKQIEQLILKEFTPKNIK
jgi:ribosomal protein S17